MFHISRTSFNIPEHAVLPVIANSLVSTADDTVL